MVRPALGHNVVHIAAYIMEPDLGDSSMYHNTVDIMGQRWLLIVVRSALSHNVVHIVAHIMEPDFGDNHMYHNTVAIMGQRCIIM